MKRSKPARPWTLYGLTLLLLVLGVNALAGGGLFLLDVSGAKLGAQLEWLEGTPFTDYLIPGLFLFGVIGVGSFVVLAALWLRPNIALLVNLTRATREHWAWSAALLLGVIVILWILIQYLLIQMFHPMQVMIGAIGLLIAALDVLPVTRRYYAEGN